MTNGKTERDGPRSLPGSGDVNEQMYSSHAALQRAHYSLTPCKTEGQQPVLEHGAACLQNFKLIFTLLLSTRKENLLWQQKK